MIWGMFYDWEIFIASWEEDVFIFGGFLTKSQVLVRLDMICKANPNDVAYEDKQI